MEGAGVRRKTTTEVGDVDAQSCVPSGARASGMRCHLKKCIQGTLEAHLARVEVKAFEAADDERGDMVINWQEDGQAMFHDICWKAIIDSYKMDNPFALGPREKEMVKEAWKTAEYFDSSERVKSETKRIAQMLKTAKYGIAFTGAGISTAAGIGDFRGKVGQWTERDREKTYGPATKTKKSPSSFAYSALRPTYTHEAFAKLLELGYLKHIMSQNTDGLHRLSGVPRDKISELHGNSFIEKCEKCSARYERPYPVGRSRDSTVPSKICQHCHTNHRTGRLCERKGCDGYLMNIIINFGDGLEHNVLTAAEEHAMKNDLMVCLGTSLRVTPACDLVEMGQKPVRLVICNRQPTPFDSLCYQVLDKDHGQVGSRVYIDCDHFMRELMAAVLPEDQLKEWHESVETKKEEYAKQRHCP